MRDECVKRWPEDVYRADGRQEGGPPAGSEAEVPHRDKSGRSQRQKEQDGPDPSQPDLDSLPVQDTGLPNIAGESGPSAVVVGHLAGRVVGLEITLGPVVLIETESISV